MNRLSRESWAGRAARAAAAVCCALVLPSAALAQVPCAYEVTEVIEAPPCQFGNSVHATALSPSGKYACGYVATCGTGDTNRAWLYDTATDELLLLPLPAGIVTSMARDVSEEYVVGEYASLTGSFGFIYKISTGEYTSLLAQSPEGFCKVAEINSNGTACGWRSVDDGGDPVHPWVAFIYDTKTGTLTDLVIPGDELSGATGISEAGAVTGTVRINNTPHPFVWKDGKVQVLDFVSEFANAIEDESIVVGAFASIPGSSNEAYVWDGQNLFALGFLSAHNRSIAWDINKDGIVVGFSRNDRINGDDRAVIWVKQEIIELATLVESGGWIQMRTAVAINDSGQILAGVLSDDFVIIALVLTPVSMFGDVTSDCEIDVDDLLAVINQWSDTDSPADLDKSGVVDGGDLQIVIDNWTFE